MVSQRTWLCLGTIITPPPRLGSYVVLEQPANPGNVALAMRTCEAFGVSELITIAAELDASPAELRKRSVSASDWVQWTALNSVEECTRCAFGLLGAAGEGRAGGMRGRDVREVVGCRPANRVPLARMRVCSRPHSTPGIKP